MRRELQSSFVARFSLVYCRWQWLSVVICSDVTSVSFNSPEIKFVVNVYDWQSVCAVCEKRFKFNFTEQLFKYRIETVILRKKCQCNTTNLKNGWYHCCANGRTRTEVSNCEPENECCVNELCVTKCRIKLNKIAYSVKLIKSFFCLPDYSRRSRLPESFSPNST